MEGNGRARINNIPLLEHQEISGRFTSKVDSEQTRRRSVTEGNGPRYGVARNGRWTGITFPPHELAAKQTKDLERLRKQIKDGDTEDLRKEFEMMKAQLDETLRQSQEFKLKFMQRAMARSRRVIGVSWLFFFRCRSHFSPLGLINSTMHTFVHSFFVSLYYNHIMYTCESNQNDYMAMLG